MMWIWYAVAAAMTWGLEYALLDRILAGKVSPVFLRTLQMLAGFLSFGIVAMVGGRFLEEARHAFSEPGTLPLLALSLVTFSVANLLIAMSIRDGSALLAGLVEMSYPLFIVLFTIMLFGHIQLSAGTLLGGMLILCGLGVLRYWQ